MSADSPFNVEYRGPTPSSNGAGPKYLVSRLITSYIGYAIVMVVLALIAPRFARLFADFKLELPLMTRALLGLSRLCTRYYLWAACIPLPAGWAYGNYQIPDQRIRHALRAVALVLVLLFLVVAIAALFLPTITLMNAAKK